MCVLPHIADCVGDRFVPQSLIASSVTKDVLLALDLTTSQDVVLKIGRAECPAVRRSLAGEAARCQALTHSTVPRIIAADAAVPAPYVASTLSSGAPLRGPHGIRAVRAMAVDLLSLLHLLDAAGVEHPHLDDRHVLVDAHGAVQVCGWSSAFVAAPGADRRMRFAVGCILHRALTGRDAPVPSAANPQASMAQAIEQHAPAALALDPILVGVIDALAQEDPEARPDPLELLQLLGLATSTLSGVGDTHARTVRRVRYLFGLVVC